MSNKLTILVNDAAEVPYLKEHGIAILIEYNGSRILFDTAQNEALFYNAKQLDISFLELNSLILSHGHYDHGGNVFKILEKNPLITFFAHPDCLNKRYSYHKGKEPKFAGLSEINEKAITSLPSDHCSWCDIPTEIIPNVWVTGEIPKKNNFEDTGGDFYLDKEGQIVDLLKDDLSMWIVDKGELVIVCGCCHSGIINTIEYIKKISKISKIKTLIGGFHLKKANEARISKSIKYLNSLGINKIIPLHCTGKNIIKIFKEKLDTEVVDGKTGLVVRV